LKSNFVKVLKNYATFSGRARRREYWYYYLVIVTVSIGLNIIGGLTGISILSPVFLFATLLPSIAVSARRMHDVEKEWFFMLIPFYNLYLACMEGTKGSNEFGVDPKVYLFENYNVVCEKPLILKGKPKRKGCVIFLIIGFIFAFVFVCLALSFLWLLLSVVGLGSSG
jgi:uncharacterized membrane protein YhaH (DUF805 family)